MTRLVTSELVLKVGNPVRRLDMISSMCVKIHTDHEYSPVCEDLDEEDEEDEDEDMDDEFDWDDEDDTFDDEDSEFDDELDDDELDDDELDDDE